MLSKRRRFGTDNNASNAVLGEMLFLVVLVGATTITALTINEDDPLEDPKALSMFASLSCGVDGVWNTGDERFVLQHQGGHDIHRDEARIIISNADKINYYPSSTAGSGDLPMVAGVNDEVSFYYSNLFDTDSTEAERVKLAEYLLSSGAQLNSDNGQGENGQGENGQGENGQGDYLGDGLLGGFVNDEKLSLKVNEYWSTAGNFTNVNFNYRIAAQGDRDLRVVYDGYLDKVNCKSFNTVEFCTPIPLPAQIHDSLLNNIVVGGDGQDGTLAQATVTVADVPDRLLVVVIADDDLAITETVSSLTYEGQALTKIDREQNLEGSPTSHSDQGVEMWYLVNPPVGTGQIEVNWPSTIDAWVMGVMLLSHVDQAQPIVSHATAVGDDYVISVPITTTVPNALLVGGLVHDEYGAIINALPPGVMYFETGGPNSIEAAGGTQQAMVPGLQLWQYIAADVPISPSGRDWSAVVAEVRPSTESATLSTEHCL